MQVAAARAEQQVPVAVGSLCDLAGSGMWWQQQ
jgi:hypothetical protein